MTWKELVMSSRIRWAGVFCFITAMIMAFYVPGFYRDIIGPKQGLVLNDIVLNLLSPFDWSIPTFAILYVSVVHTLWSGLKEPRIVVLGVTTYCAATLLRMASMYCLTLEPPEGMILLIDPISSSLYPDSAFAKDLFFSGHISTMMILVLLEPSPAARRLKAAGTAIMGLLLAWQHVHYTLDILAAPPATYLVFAQIRRILHLT